MEIKYVVWVKEKRDNLFNEKKIFNLISGFGKIVFLFGGKFN